MGDSKLEVLISTIVAGQAVHVKYENVTSISNEKGQTHIYTEEGTVLFSDDPSYTYSITKSETKGEK